MTDAEQRERTAVDVAKFFLHIAAEQGNQLNEPTLQRLCYYAQGFHLAMYHDPLFVEAIEACEEGPVIREVRREFAAGGARPIRSDPSFDEEKFAVMEEAVMHAIYREFRADGEAERVTAEQADFLLRITREDGTQVSHEQMRTCFRVAIELEPRTPPRPVSDEELQASSARSRADIAAGRLRPYRRRR